MSIVAAPRRVTVAGDRPYDVVIGRGLDGELAPLLTSGTRVALIHPSSMGDRAGALAALMAEAGQLTHLVPVPDGEAQKTLATAGLVWEAFGRAGLTRTDTVVSLGGGATTDLAGFAAATWLRGVSVVHVPTTLLAMVDAAVGGKTGINTAAGKNLVGSFHPPAAVLCDLDALETLPPVDYVAGLAEVVKVGFTHDPVILELLESDVLAATSPDGPHTAELIERAVAVKARVVSEDLREAGQREFLNYGHTLAHAIERVEGFTWRHGEAVSVGLVFAAELGRLAGRLDASLAGRHRAVLTALGLPTSYAGAWGPVHEAMRIDKKSRGDLLRFVILDGLGRPAMLEDPPSALLVEAFAQVDPGGPR
ncbi:MAG: 3-dehydroquinate synthase [Actinomycetota bacterium]|nr:3-dehydroquinate synthase [Actinomycetota bacterium]